MAEGTPFTITNCNIISLDKEAKIGKGNKPYLLFKFNVDHPKVQGIEFAKFCFTNKPDDWPRVGKIISMTGKMEESGQYTNYTVSKITFDPTSKPPPVEKHPLESEEDPFAPSGAPSETIPPKTETIKGLSETITVSQGTCISYVKDTAIARLAWVEHRNLPTLAEMMAEIAIVAPDFYRDCVKGFKRMEE